jgi:hypothetical protein
MVRGKAPTFRYPSCLKVFTFNQVIYSPPSLPFFLSLYLYILIEKIGQVSKLLASLDSFRYN